MHDIIHIWHNAATGYNSCILYAARLSSVYFTTMGLNTVQVWSVVVYDICRQLKLQTTVRSE